MSMKLKEYALWAEIISAIAIVISLIFVGLQVRQSASETALNTNAIQSTVRQAILSEDRESLYIVIEYPFLNKRTNLSPEQEIQLTAFLVALIRMRENHWLQFQNGVLDEATWLSYRFPLLRSVFSSEFGRNVWQENAFDPVFVESINEWVNGLTIVDSDVMFIGTELL